MNLQGKHVFLISNNDKFFYLFADALVKKCDVPADNIVAVVLKVSQYGTLDRRPPFNYVNSESYNVKDLLMAKSITSMSLTSWNASLVKKSFKKIMK